MPRDIPVGNGQLLVAFDTHYRIRDLYYPHVGQENHAGHSPCNFGVWAGPLEPPQVEPNEEEEADEEPTVPPCRLYWSDNGWHIERRYVEDTLATQVLMRHDQAKVELRCRDVVDFHRPLLVRRIDVRNTAEVAQDVRLFHHNQFHMYGNDIGDTAYLDPQLNSLVHYRSKRYLLVCWYRDGAMAIDEYATGTSGFKGAEGTWRDAEDGHLGNNPIAQGAVDSTMMLRLTLEPGASQTVYMLIGAGQSYEDLNKLEQFVARETPQGVIDRTMAYWRLWLNANRALPLANGEGAPPPKVVELFKRSLLLVRSQIDNSGAIIAANDSDFMQYSRDTYSYLWPRDGALVAAAMDMAGFPDVARGFYALCAKLITDEGYFLHKYNPDGSPASSWHPWVVNGEPQLPIQEDETALVIWAIWHHYLIYNDIEFVRPLWVNLITRAANFMARYRDPVTKLPLPSYDLWEERWGVHAFTVASTFAGLMAAWQFAVAFGDEKLAKLYGNAALEIRDAFCKYFWSDKLGRFVRRLIPRDNTPYAEFMQRLHADRLRERGESGRRGVISPDKVIDETEHPKRGNGRTADDLFEIDPIIDSSMHAIFAMKLLDVHDPRVAKTMQAIEDRLWVKTPVGGIARYERDTYHATTGDVEAVPGNPWFICTLWMAQYRIAKARDIKELEEALPILEWVASHALPSGVLAEQVHPLSNDPLSVSPLTWSHATVVSAFMAYLNKLKQMQACPTCGQQMAQEHVHNEPEPATMLDDQTSELALKNG